MAEERAGQIGDAQAVRHPQPLNGFLGEAGDALFVPAEVSGLHHWNLPAFSFGRANPTP
jgi:hypothetical protein